MRALGHRLLDGKGLPQDLAEGEQWLRKAAAAGDAVAMGILGVRLLDGSGLAANSAEGEEWLRRAAAAGFEDAMRALGLRLLDGKKLPQNPAEGEEWLRKAAAAGDEDAMRALGQRLLDGVGLPQNLAEGEQWLRKAAAAGDAMAMGSLGVRLLDGDGLAANSAEGEEWLRRAAASDEDAMYVLAQRLLEGNGLAQDLVEGEAWLRRVADRNLAARAELGCRLVIRDANEEAVAEGRRHLAEAAASAAPDEITAVGLSCYQAGEYALAARTFLRGLHLEDGPICGNNLVYMLRRGEIPAAMDLPAVVDLLAEGIRQKDPFALVNQALCRAAGIQCTADWAAADHLIAGLSRADDVREWWYELARRDDPEGHLVIGWLVRHGRIADPDGMDLAQRMARARSGGWQAPEWMDQRA
jgi:TPR repeat protein